MQCLGLMALFAPRTYGQIPVGSPNLDEELVRLTEAIDSVTAFTAHYSVLIDGSPAGNIKLAYRAPDTAAIQTTLPDTSSSVWYVEGILTVLSSSAEGTEWGQMNTHAVIEGFEDMCAPLYELFNGLDPPTYEKPRPVFHIHIEENDEDDSVIKWSVTIETAWKSFFCWHGGHRDLWDTVTLDEDDLVFHAGGQGVLRIARGEPSGFPIGASGPYDKGQLELHLVTLEYEIDESLLDIPDRPEGVQNVFEGSDDAKILANDARVEVHRKVAQQLGDGRLAWDSDIKERFSLVLEGIHRQWLLEHYSGWIAGRRESILERADLILKGLDEGVDEEELLGFVTRGREKLEEALRTGADACVGTFTAVVEGAWGEELLSVEQEVVRSLFDETVAQPLFEFYVAEVEDLL